MAYVRGHYRSDGTYVRPHHRRSSSSARSVSPTWPVAPRRAGTTTPAPSPVPAGATTRIRGHYRNGAYVRPHRRRISAKEAAGGGGGLLLLLLVLLLLGGGGKGESSPSNTSDRIAPQPSAAQSGSDGQEFAPRPAR